MGSLHRGMQISKKWPNIAHVSPNMSNKLLTIANILSQYVRVSHRMAIKIKNSCTIGGTLAHLVTYYVWVLCTQQ